MAPRFILSLIVLGALGATLALAQDRFPTPNGNVNAVGEVAMCGSTAAPASGTPFAAFVPCTAPGARPLPVAVVNTPTEAPQQPQGTITAIATGSTAAVVATLSAPGKTVWLCNLDVSAIGGTAAIGPITITGLLGGTFTYQLSSTTAGITLSRTFTPCIPAKDTATNIVITTTADGTASAVDINASGLAQ
jgi:hypothetical protein